MFERWRERHAEHDYEKALAAWQQRRDAQAELLTLAEHFAGLDSDEIMLRKDERLFLKVASVALVEERVLGGHYQGGSHGVSVPVGSIGGRTIRYHVGAQKGHYVQGTPTPTAIDHGDVYITNQRVVFSGANQTRECSFSKLIGVQHDAQGSSTFAVSNREKPTTIFYGPEVAGQFDFRLQLALAHYKGTVSEIIATLREDVAQLDAQRPQEPAALPE